MHKKPKKYIMFFAVVVSTFNFSAQAQERKTVSESLTAATVFSSRANTGR